METYSLTCPWCGSSTEVTVDDSAQSQEFVEDCLICCGPIVVTVSRDAVTGQPIEVAAIREND